MLYYKEAGIKVSTSSLGLLNVKKKAEELGSKWCDVRKAIAFFQNQGMWAPLEAEKDLESGGSPRVSRKEHNADILILTEWDPFWISDPQIIGQ